MSAPAPSRLRALLPALLDPRIAPHARTAGGGLAAVTAATLGASAASAGAALALAAATTRILVQDPRAPWTILLAAVADDRLIAASTADMFPGTLGNVSAVEQIAAALYPEEF